MKSSGSGPQLVEMLESPIWPPGGMGAVFSKYDAGTPNPCGISYNLFRYLNRGHMHDVRNAISGTLGTQKAQPKRDAGHKGK